MESEDIVVETLDDIILSTHLQCNQSMLNVKMIHETTCNVVSIIWEILHASKPYPSLGVLNDLKIMNDIIHENPPASIDIHGTRSIQKIKRKEKSEQNVTKTVKRPEPVLQSVKEVQEFRMDLEQDTKKLIFLLPEEEILIDKNEILRRGQLLEILHEDEVTKNKRRVLENRSRSIHKLPVAIACKNYMGPNGELKDGCSFEDKGYYKQKNENLDAEITLDEGGRVIIAHNDVIVSVKQMQELVEKLSPIFVEPCINQKCKEGYLSELESSNDYFEKIDEIVAGNDRIAILHDLEKAVDDNADRTILKSRKTASRNARSRTPGSIPFYIKQNSKAELSLIVSDPSLLSLGVTVKQGDNVVVGNRDENSSSMTKAVSMPISRKKEEGIITMSLSQDNINVISEETKKTIAPMALVSADLVSSKPLRSIRKDLENTRIRTPQYKARISRKLINEWDKVQHPTIVENRYLKLPPSPHQKLVSPAKFSPSSKYRRQFPSPEKGKIHKANLDKLIENNRNT